jgi:hypothetical protein
MKKLLYFSVSLLFCCGCKESVKKEEPVEKVAKAELKPEESRAISNPAEVDSDNYEPVFNDFLISAAPQSDFMLIDKPAAIFIGPDSLQIERMKKEQGEESFYTIADDNIYYEYEAKEFLRKKNLGIIDLDKRYLKFKLNNGTELFFDSESEKNPGWVTILFDPKQQPKIINPTETEEEFQKYFERK